MTDSLVHVVWFRGGLRIVDIADPLGNIGAFRLNHLHPPFNDVKVRQAVAYGIDPQGQRYVWFSIEPADSLLSCMPRDARLIVTTNVSGFGFTSRFSCFLGSAGTFASNLLGLTGVMIIKMINRTRRMSIRGVTFISGRAISFPLRN